MFDPASPRAVEPLSAARLIEKAQDNTFSDKHIEHAVKSTRPAFRASSSLTAGPASDRSWQQGFDGLTFRGHALGSAFRKFINLL
jgi:hypothetical protein